MRHEAAKVAWHTVMLLYYSTHFMSTLQTNKMYSKHTNKFIIIKNYIVLI